MTVKFSKKHSNYNQMNMIQLLNRIPDDFIRYLVNHPTDYIKIMGDIHRSQYSSDNPKNNFWFKIKGYSNDIEIPHLKSIHIYVCFQLYTYNPKYKKYVHDKCINPPTKEHTDLADVDNLTGFWDFANISYSHTPPKTKTKTKQQKKSIKSNTVRDEMMKLFSKLSKN